MKTFLDVIQEDGFRNKVQKILSFETANPFYSFKKNFPILYRYRPLSQYTIDDIIYEKLTASRISNFNDVFDGAVQIYNTDKKCCSAAKSEYKRYSHGFSTRKSLKGKNEFITAASFHYNQRSLRYFHYLDNLKFSACCFSSKNDSTLMWAHYAESNKGICIGYDFNALNENSILRKSLFPIAYSNRPLDLSKLFNEKSKSDVLYPYDTAALCTALCKAKCWKYEHEWRLIFDSSFIKQNSQYLSYPFKINISIILFGFDFLKNLFYNKSDNKANYDRKKNFEKLIMLLDYMIQNNVQAGIMQPKSNTFTLQTKTVNPLFLKNFMLSEFKTTGAEPFCYYYVTQEKFLNWLSKHRLCVHIWLSEHRRLCPHDLVRANP